MYDVVIADQKSPRDGRFIEKIGTYNPNTNPASIDLNEERALRWLLVGAQPSPTVKAMLSYRGLMLKKHLQIGVLKGAISQEEADKKFEEWKTTKDSKISNKVDTLAAKKAADEKARLEAEAKVKEKRAEEIRKKQEAEEAAKNPPKEEAPVEEVKDETPAEETPAADVEPTAE